MSVQRFRMKEILAELKRRGCFTVVGGPLVTVQEDYFEGLADVIFIGEAEETWPQFLNEWKQGLHQYRYEQIEKSDMSKVPTPRFDKLKMRHYAYGSMQISRGCPFQCEFCDIIVTFGRRPRLKTTEQIIAELEALRAERMKIVFIVDDNLIGNRKEIKKILREIADWQLRNAFPLTLFTEASIDLADDAELMELMVEANFIAVFVGVESPERGVAPRDEEVPERPPGRDDGREAPPDPGRRDGDLGRDDHRLRQRRRDDLRPPGRVPRAVAGRRSP